MAANESTPPLGASYELEAGRAMDFDGRQESWRDWAPRPKCCAEGIRVDDLMEWAAKRMAGIYNDELGGRESSEAR